LLVSNCLMGLWIPHNHLIQQLQLILSSTSLQQKSIHSLFYIGYFLLRSVFDKTDILVGWSFHIFYIILWQFKILNDVNDFLKFINSFWKYLWEENTMSVTSSVFRYVCEVYFWFFDEQFQDKEDICGRSWDYDVFVSLDEFISTASLKIRVWLRIGTSVT
jgi:hypothetical protein